MSTRSSISKVNADGTITSIYCHHDGYLAHVGYTLLKHYNDQAKLDQLLAQGDTSSIAPVLTDCTPYNDDTAAHVAQTKEEFEQWWSDSWVAYFYQMRDGVWYWGRDANDINTKLTQKDIDADE